MMYVWKPLRTNPNKFNSWMMLDVYIYIAEFELFLYGFVFCDPF